MNVEVCLVAFVSLSSAGDHLNSFVLLSMLSLDDLFGVGPMFCGRCFRKQSQTQLAGSRSSCQQNNYRLHTSVIATLMSWSGERGNPEWRHAPPQTLQWKKNINNDVIRTQWRTVQTLAYARGGARDRRASPSNWSDASAADAKPLHFDDVCRPSILFFTARSRQLISCAQDVTPPTLS